ncbi:MAG: 2TM domain-containing protein [Rhodospirillales bacterium]|jgi:transcriptional regulator with XRE-family HTH domain
MNTANSLKQLRLDRGWSQEQLAGISGVSVRTIQRLEQGAPAGLESAKALAAAFGLTPADLQLNGKEAPMTADRIDAAPCPHKQAETPEERRHRFWHHLFVYVLVIGGLTILNLTRSPDHVWVLYPAVLWGIFLAHRGLKLFGPSRHRE